MQTDVKLLFPELKNNVILLTKQIKWTYMCMIIINDLQLDKYKKLFEPFFNKNYFCVYVIFSIYVANDQ